MSISTSDLKVLFAKSGNRCAFPNCGKLLFEDVTEIDDSIVNRSEIAHIVAQSLDGPRGKYPLPIEERDNESNLILLCEEHHHLVDDNSRVPYYTVERLRQYKEDHEAQILEATGKAVTKQIAQQSNIQETVHSTLFNVIGLPGYVYSAPCRYTILDEVKNHISKPADDKEIYPFVTRGNELYAFQNLSDHRGPFRDVVARNKVQAHACREWWDDPVKLLLYIELLNRSLNKLTGRKGLRWDREHKRYYFQPDTPGQIKEITYRPLNVATGSKQVVWQPITKRTGQPKSYWLHRAVGLRFHRVSSSQWCLSIRPEFRVTRDGITPLASEKIGAKVTRKKSRMFNYDLLNEVNFWRDFLCEGNPRIILSYGEQRMIISSEMAQTEIEWPGIPEKYAKPFKNIEYVENLFTWAELENIDVDVDTDDDEDEFDEEVEDDE